MKYDYKTFYEKQTNFINARPTLKRALPLIDKLLTAFFGLAYALLWLLVLNSDDCNLKDYLLVFFCPAVALVSVSILQVCIARPRPYSENGAGITPLFVKKRGSENNSMPSRHAACSVALALTFAAYLLPVGMILFFPALLLSYARYVMGWHYPSDIALGGVIGVISGALAFIL